MRLLERTALVVGGGVYLHWLIGVVDMEETDDTDGEADI